MSSTKPIKFSEHFKIDKAKLFELKVFDPFLNHDTKLFVDLLLLKDSASKIMREAFSRYNSFFADLLKLLNASQQVGDKSWRAAKRMVNFPEYKYTCIGYGTGTINGAGSGAVLNDKILISAKEIITFAQNDPSIFLLLPLLEEGIGADIISDMTQNIIDDYICEYTIDVMEKLGIEGTCKHKSRSNTVYSLPYNPYHKCAIKLLPLDILSNLPLAETIDSWLLDISQENAVLRSQVNNLIGTTWLDATKSERKETILELIKKNKDFFLSTLEALQNETFESYDLEKDFEGLYRWFEDANVVSKIIDRGNVSGNLSLFETIGMIISDFKNLIEEHELWRMFWTDLYKKRKHVKEFYSQMLFYMVSSAWVAAQGNKLLIDRIFNKESHQLEIVFAIAGQQKVKVQVKHNDNSSGLKKCYEDLVAHCVQKNLKCYYLIMHFTDRKSEQHKHILATANESCKIVEIDVMDKEQTACTFDHDDFTFDHNALTFDGLTFDFENMVIEFEDIDNDYYASEKRRGGTSSYKNYKPLKEKTQEICRHELESRTYKSALELSYVVAEIIERDHKDLLKNFTPYARKQPGREWAKESFYKWCKKIYNSMKDSNIEQIN